MLIGTTASQSTGARKAKIGGDELAQQHRVRSAFARGRVSCVVCSSMASRAPRPRRRSSRRRWRSGPCRHPRRPASGRSGERPVVAGRRSARDHDGQRGEPEQPGHDLLEAVGRGGQQQRGAHDAADRPPGPALAGAPARFRSRPEHRPDAGEDQRHGLVTFALTGARPTASSAG